MRSSARGLAVGLVLSLASSSLAAQQGSAARQALPSVVTIRAYDAGGDPMGFGSGFFLRDGRVVTSSHVVAGAEWVEVADQNGEFLGSSPYAEVVSTRSDLAILPSLSVDRRGLRISSERPRPGEDVWVVGSPEGLHGSVSAGVVSAVRSVEGREYLQITAPISSGSSGGPILDADGRVIGVVASYVTEGQNLNFGVPAGQLRALASSPSGKHAFGRMERGPRREERSSAGTSEPSTDDVVDGATTLVLPDYAAGRLTRSDFDMEDRFADLYLFQGERGQQVSVLMVSDEIDTQLAIVPRSELGTEDPWIRADDDGGEGTNARLTATLPEDGEYVVVASSYESEFGEYSLALLEGSPSDWAEGDDGGAEDEERWRYVGVSSDSTEWYWDRSSVTWNDLGYLEVWAGLMYPGGSEYDVTKQRLHLDCDGRRLRISSFFHYRDDDMVDEGTGRSSWTDVPPESMGEAFLTEVCEAHR